MLVVGTRSGSLETVLASLSDTFFDDSIVRLDGLIDSVEPTLAAFLTVGVGATLIAVMLPLIGIMGIHLGQGAAMYHELTRQEVSGGAPRDAHGRPCSPCWRWPWACAVGLSSNAIGASLREQGELSVRNAILNSAKQRCAIEGAYPSSLAYLEENYGLVVNRSDYAITYEVFADNVMPNVVVLAR